MQRSLMGCAVAVAMVAFSGEMMAQITAGGDLGLSPAGPSICPGERVFFTGQSVQLTGSGFDSAAVIKVYFSINDEEEVLLDTVGADSSGVLDAVVALPDEVSTPAMGVLEVRGQTSGGGLLSLIALFDLAASAGADTDTDLVPDMCDNCPAVPNSGQENGDLDGFGDACDPCPSDHSNDGDGDGLCANVDPCPFDADNDVDGDQVCGDEDNCPNDANPDQRDRDRNGIGDACQTSPTCSDGLDNDGDGLVDHPADAGCSDPDDTTETDPALPCDDGIDNDADALVDYRPGGNGDPGCADGTSPAEDPECDDLVDNDGDGKVDWDGDYGVFTPDPDCGGVGSNTTELPEPTVIWGLLWGVALLAVLNRRRRRVGSSRGPARDSL